MIDQMKNRQAARLAMARNEDYQKAMNELQAQIHQVECGEDKVVRENWKDLKKIRRT